MSALASPPAVAPRPHPFDNDWPAVQLILNDKCTSCHRRGVDRTDFTSYQALLGARMEGDPNEPVVIPGNANESPLWEYVAWNVNALLHAPLPSEPMMPEDKHEWLTTGQLDTLHRWINSGAFQYKRHGADAVRPLMETDFPSAKQCGQCHPREYREWSRSMHAYAQQSPAFVALNSHLQERTGGTIGTLCSRCHTPVGTALGENALMQNNHRSRISMEGVTCVACHRRASPHYKASGRVAVLPGSLLETCVFGPFENPVYSDSETHKSQPLPYIKSSQFCAECHDVFNPRGLRLEEAFSEWQNSPAAKQGITCQMCHMGPVQGQPIPDDGRPWGRIAEVPGIPPERIPLRRIVDHTFAGPDYSLLPNTEFPHKLDWMYEVDYRDVSKLTPHQRRTLYEIRLKNRDSLRIANAKRHELFRGSAKLSVSHPQIAAAGRKTRVRVDVTNNVAGHNFPTGFAAERQLWVSIAVVDPFGRTVFASGDFDHNADLRDNHSHEVLAGKIGYDKHLLNFQNKFVALANKGAERSVVIPVNRDIAPLNVLRPATGIAASFGHAERFRIAKGGLPPLATIGRNYPVELPSPGTYRLRVQLNFRHLPPVLLDKLGASAAKPLVEIIVIDWYEAMIEAR
ncbi:MAG: multiheme c-type cytochrome [Pirellulaceae bacterium]|jgi:hypothetical protein|nr:multiheme c-type cytochrome [Pirellulaceae bacterium]MDP7017084.1 multiheme c-type cytochrome [Pirellulaceae bacterium]